MQEQNLPSGGEPPFILSNHGVEDLITFNVDRKMKLCCLFKVEKDLKQRQRTRDQSGGVGKPGVGLQDH